MPDLRDDDARGVDAAPADVDRRAGRKWLVGAAVVVLVCAIVVTVVVRAGASSASTTSAVATAGCGGTLVVRPIGSGPAAQINQWSTQPGTDTSGWHGEAGELEVDGATAVFRTESGFQVRVFVMAVDCE
jgi:hypothetical protein